MSVFSRKLFKRQFYNLGVIRQVLQIGSNDKQNRIQMKEDLIYNGKTDLNIDETDT